jgi:hypothetical protein
MIKHIYLDVDDTLNDFTMFALRLMGCPATSIYPADVGYDITAAYNRLRPDIPTDSDLTPREFWSILPERAWSDAPPNPMCSWLLKECVSIVGQENVFLCTSSSCHHTSLSGKLRWIQRNLPNFLHRQYVITPHKYLLAQDALLIDDAPKQCENFRRAGGEIIMVPKPWNVLRNWDTEEYIRACLPIFR